MKTNPWIDPRVETVRVANARDYMLRHGWSPQPFPRSQVSLFAGPLDDSGVPIELVVPTTENSSDYAQRLIELITSLARIEDRSTSAVLDEMLQQSAIPSLPLPNGANRGATAPPID